LTRAEIVDTIGDFANAAWMAMEAGADAVEIHGANGFLLQQFLASNANHRNDEYGSVTTLSPSSIQSSLRRRAGLDAHPSGKQFATG
jgi:hypothetical protein